MTFVSALILGLLASAHCAGMCGGFQFALQSNNVSLLSEKELVFKNLLLNLGRITTYLVLGLLFSWIGFAFIAASNLPNLSHWMRVIAALVIILIGIQVLLGRNRPFQFLESVGAHSWSRFSKLIRPNTTRNWRVFTNGLVWGLLPCGLIYSVLITAFFANGRTEGLLIALGFGLGTLPSLMLTGVALRKFKDQLSSSKFRTAGGLFFVIGGVLMLTAPFWVNKSFINRYPELLNSVFCFT